MSTTTDHPSTVSHVVAVMHSPRLWRDRETDGKQEAIFRATQTPPSQGGGVRVGLGRWFGSSLATVVARSPDRATNEDRRSLFRGAATAPEGRPAVLQARRGWETAPNTNDENRRQIRCNPTNQKAPSRFPGLPAGFACR
jgi:hypothetical protein